MLSKCSRRKYAFSDGVFIAKRDMVDDEKRSFARVDEQVNACLVALEREVEAFTFKFLLRILLLCYQCPISEGFLGFK